MEQMLSFIKERPNILEYFPSEEEIPKAGKEWVVNMLQTLGQDDFQTWVRQAETARKEKIDQKENRNVGSYYHKISLQIPIAPAFISKLSQTIQISTEKGKLLGLPPTLIIVFRKGSPNGKGGNEEKAQ